MSYLFTSESVSEGHPDKVADQISDAILDEFLRQDSESKVACETFVSTGLVVIGGEVRSEAYVDIQQVARKVINRIGYTKAEYMFDGNSCGILSALHEQSPDINRGVVVANRDEQGAGAVGPGQALQGRLHHGLGAGGVEVHHVHPQAGEHRHGLLHRVGDVVELQVQENLMPPVLDLPDDGGPLGVVELHADLHKGLLPGELVQKGQGLLLAVEIQGDDHVFTHGGHLL